MRKMTNSTAVWSKKFWKKIGSQHSCHDTVYLYIAAFYFHKSFWRQMFSVLPSLYVNNSRGSKIISVMHSSVSTAGETSVTLPLGGHCDIEWERTSTEYTSINSNGPTASSRFCCFALSIKDCYSKLAAESCTRVIYPFLLTLCFQMVKDHLLCSHTCQHIMTLLILHIMSIISQIHYALWSISIIYLISLLSRCNVRKKRTMSLKIIEQMQLKAIFHSSREACCRSVIPEFTQYH